MRSDKAFAISQPEAFVSPAHPKPPVVSPAWAQLPGAKDWTVRTDRRAEEGRPRAADAVRVVATDVIQRSEQFRVRSPTPTEPHPCTGACRGSIHFFDQLGRFGSLD